MEKLILCTIMLIVIMITNWFGYADSQLHVGSGCSQSENTNVSNNPVYQANLRTLLTSLATNVPLKDGFFYNASVGNTSDDRVYGLAWCRGDVSPDTCSECLNNTIRVPLEECPESKGLVLWYNTCSLRFKNESFFGELWNESSSATYGGNGLDDPSVFSAGFSMMESLVRNVSNNAPILMFYSSLLDFGGRERYGLSQCSRDLSNLDCRNCLEELLTTYKTYVLNRTGWEMQGMSCGMWYEMRGLNPSPNASGTSFKHKVEMILALVAFLVFF
uniref:cysteine-rich repeat secretory protein 38-like n=1 Tax=Erigeron canadensis TaxID=72917 RepID=UPI001CB8DD8F|nr:cysteine-rich repeat secretory protein 38-like [Erigeron canadensis]